MNLLNQAESILLSAKEGMHVNDIAAKIVAANPGENLETVKSKLSAALAANVKKKDARFSKIKNKSGGLRKGIYRIKKQSQQKVVASILPEPVDINDTGFIGRAGEYAVMSEMLFLGFNVSLMSVDKGIDVVAENDGKYFHIQVKTATVRDGVYSFGIKRKSFESNNNGLTFYIFVMRGNKRSNLLIFPSSHITTFVDAGLVKGVDTLGFRVSYEGKQQKYTLNNKQDLALYVNKFGLIC